MRSSLPCIIALGAMINNLASLASAQEGQLAAFLGSNHQEAFITLSEYLNCRDHAEDQEFTCRIRNEAEIKFFSIESSIYRIEVNYSQIGFREPGDMIYGRPSRPVGHPEERYYDNAMFERFTELSARSDYYEVSVGSTTFFVPNIFGDPLLDNFFFDYECQSPHGINHETADCVAFFEVADNYVAAYSLARIRRWAGILGYRENFAGHALYLDISDRSRGVILTEQSRRRQQLGLDADEARIQRENSERRRLREMRLLAPN